MTPAAAAHHLAQARRERHAMTPEQRRAEWQHIEAQRPITHAAIAGDDPCAEINIERVRAEQ